MGCLLNGGWVGEVSLIAGGGWDGLEVGVAKVGEGKLGFN